MNAQEQPKPFVRPLEETEIAIESLAESLPKTAPAKPKIYPLLFQCLLGFIALNFGIEFFRFFGSSVSCNVTQSCVAEVKNSVGAMNRAQQAFYLDNHQFANTVESLGVGIQTQTARFNYSTHTLDNAAFSYGIPREGIQEYKTVSWGVFSWKKQIQPDLKAYVGAVFVIPQAASDNQEAQFVDILCELPNLQKTGLAKPYLKNNIPTCGEGDNP
ncbi:type IV pilin-like G/H family protein [Geitlerinema splendidum]|nr:type IV pilin-like G/H family protein [Geitlerinema splendidum]